MNRLEQSYKSFKQEAELFFITKFLESPKLIKEYEFCLDVIFDITGEVDANRGLVAFNTRYGQGKSFLFDVVNNRCRRLEGKFKFKRTTAKELAEIYTSSKDKEDPLKKLEAFIKVKNLFIDDIGDEGENKVFSNYANKLNVLRHVLLKRYEYWVSYGWKTYGTTNLTIQQIATNYDGRVSDRLLQMCYFRTFDFLDSGSFRQIEESRMLTQEERNENLKRVTPKEKEEPKIDIIKYLNELLNDLDYLQAKATDYNYWAWVCDVFMDLKVLDRREPTEEEIIKAAFSISRENVNDSIMTRDIIEFRKSLKDNKVTESQKTIHAKGERALNKFNELKKQGHEF